MIVLIKKGCNDKGKLDNMIANNHILSDTLITYKNKLGQEVAKTGVLVVENASLVDNLAEVDSSVIALKTLVKKNSKLFKSGGIASVIATTTYLQGSNDTVYVDKYGSYHANITQFSKWVTGRHMLSFDSSYIDITIENEFTLAFGYERESGLKNIFKPKKPIAYLTNKNPYTNTENFRIVNIKQNDKLLGLNVGFGIMYGLTPQLTPNLVVGLSLTKSLIKL